ncbi:hypothetical protein YK56LOC_70960 [Caballeronia sp. HLA56]
MPIQTTNLRDEEMRSIPSMAQSKWRYMGKRASESPIFHCVEGDPLEVVKVAVDHHDLDHPPVSRKEDPFH